MGWIMEGPTRKPGPGIAGVKTCQWHVFRAWESPSAADGSPEDCWQLCCNTADLDARFDPFMSGISFYVGIAPEIWCCSNFFRLLIFFSKKHKISVTFSIQNPSYRVRANKQGGEP